MVFGKDWMPPLVCTKCGIRPEDVPKGKLIPTFSILAGSDPKGVFCGKCRPKEEPEPHCETCSCPADKK